MKYPECNECKCRSCTLAFCVRNNCRICAQLHAEQSTQMNVTLVCRHHRDICEDLHIAKETRKGGTLHGRR